MKVVTNSGPLIALGKLGLLDVLFHLYGSVRIPTAVYIEVGVRGSERNYPDALLTRIAVQRGQLRVSRISDVDVPPDIASLPLNTGEKQAIYLALHDSADLVLLDDLKAREEAQARGLTIKGTLGVLVQAHQQGALQLDETQAIIETIRDRNDIWIAPGLCQRVLEKLETRRTEES